MSGRIAELQNRSIASRYRWREKMSRAAAVLRSDREMIVITAKLVKNKSRFFLMTAAPSAAAATVRPASDDPAPFLASDLVVAG